MLAKLNVTLKFPADPVLLTKPVTVMLVLVVTKSSPDGRAGLIATLRGRDVTTPEPPYADTAVNVIGCPSCIVVEAASVLAVIEGAGAMGTIGLVALYFNHSFFPADRPDPPA